MFINLFIGLGDRKDKKYYKYEVVISNKKAEEAGLSEKDELEIEVSKNKIILKKKLIRQ